MKWKLIINNNIINFKPNDCVIDLEPTVSPSELVVLKHLKREQSISDQQLICNAKMLLARWARILTEVFPPSGDPFRAAELRGKTFGPDLWLPSDQRQELPREMQLCAGREWRVSLPVPPWGSCGALHPHHNSNCRTVVFLSQLSLSRVRCQVVGFSDTRYV